MVHSKPVSGNFTVQVLISDNGPFQLGPKYFGAAFRHVVLHRLVDEAAPLTRLYQPVNGLNGCCGEDNVDAFAHGIKG